MASSLVGMLAAGALKVAGGKLAGAAADRVMRQWRLAEDLEGMQHTMESIEAVLEDAERKSPEDKPTQLWLQRLTHASYDISDMFDEFEASNTRNSALRKLKILNHCLALPSEVRMASKLKKARKTLDKISNDCQNYSAHPTSSSSGYQQVATSPEVLQEKIVGRDEEKQRIIALLKRECASSDFIVLPIYGIGGIGKTTLAQLLFNDTHFKEYEKAWVYISQTFDLKRIKEDVTSQLQFNMCQLANKQEQEAGGNASKSILIVLDDLWEKNDFKLDDMMDSLKIVGNGHKVHVIITTRDAGIAQKVQTVEPHNIQALSDDDCWDIIKQKAGFEHRADKERLEVIGKEIAKKCGGVALAARAIGYIMKLKDFHGWVSVKDSGIWNEYSPYDNVLASLKLSYNSMLPHLRLCFSYCATFPKGHKIGKDELIYQWAALGFIKPSDDSPTWRHGEDCIKQLLEMSFLDHSKSPSSDWGHRKDDTLFTMHDLVHDLARLIVAGEVIDASEKPKIGGRKCRYALLADCSNPLSSFVTDPDKIRALRFLGSGGTGFCHAEFSTAKYLRILDFVECSLKKLPSSIGQQRLLRYLNAPGITNRKIPTCLTKLSKLLYLNLSGSRGLLELPVSIGQMEGLKYLDLSQCEGIEMLPESVGELENLVHLNLSKCKRIRKLPGSFGKLENLLHLDLSECERMEMLPESFGELQQLVHLDLSKCEGIALLPESVGELENLVHLNLSKCKRMRKLPGSFGKLENLGHLDLSKCERIEMLPESFRKLKRLLHLDLSYCCKLTATPGALRSLTKLQYLNLIQCARIFKVWHEEIGELTELRYLNLSGSLKLSSSYKFGRIFDKICTLPNLEHLDLSHNCCFETLPDSLCSLRKLHTLDLTRCQSLRWLPENMGHMDSLKFLIATDCFKLDDSTLVVHKNLIPLPNFVVHATEGVPSSNLIRLKDASTRELAIHHLENVKSVQEGKIIELRKKQSLIDLRLDWTRGTKGFVEDKELLRELVPSSNLEFFALQGYNSGSFPAWLEDISSYLPNLVRVRLEGLSQCTNLPPLGQLPNLDSVHLEAMPGITKIDKSFCGDGTMKGFTCLDSLYIMDMENLEEWSTTYYRDEGDEPEFMFPNLCYLTTKRCPKLRIHRSPLKLTKWLIEDCDGVLLWKESASRDTMCRSMPAAYPSVDTLFVVSCKQPLHQWKLLTHICGLRRLRIYCCNDLSSSSDITGVLSTLEVLELWGTHALPQWIGDCVALESLYIQECKATAFPESIQQLTKLKRLTIQYCPELVKWIKLKENRTKINQITEEELCLWSRDE